MTMLSRRRLCLAGGQALVASSFAASLVAQPPESSAPTSAGVAAALAGLARADLIAGKPDAVVTSVAVVTDPSLDALRRAAAAGCSLILSAETPFYGKPADPGATGFGIGILLVLQIIHSAVSLGTALVATIFAVAVLRRLLPRVGAPRSEPVVAS